MSTIFHNMTVDFTIKPHFTGGGSWDYATVRVNTNSAVKAYNEYFGTERKKGDTFSCSAKSYKEIEMMAEMQHLSIIFG